MENSNKDYTIVKGSGSNEELENYRLCFERNGTPRDIKNLQWLHQQNPLHRNAIYYAMYDNNIAAIFTALPFIFRINGSFFPGLQSFDTLTDMDHRGKGLFNKLGDKLNNDEAANSAVLIFGFPNDISAPVYYTKQKWIPLGEAPFLIKPINPLSYLIKKVFKKKTQTGFSWSNYIFDAPATQVLDKNNVIRTMNIFEDDYEQLWNSVAQNIKVCVDRSARYMNWRYVDKPIEHYYRYGFYTNNKLTGCIIFSIKNKHDGLIGYLMELIFDPKDLHVGKHLLKFSSKLFKQHKVDVILAWSVPGCFNYAAYKKSGYFSLPEKLRPQKLFFGARAFDESNAATILNARNWYISYSDSDTA